MPRRTSSRAGRVIGGIRRRTVERAGLRFEVCEHGRDDGPMVLLLHGFPADSSMWDAQLVSLAGAGYHAIAPDQRGTSPAARPPAVAAYRLDELVADAVAFADAAGAPRFHVVGHDWGGAVAWAVAARHPDRIRTLTVLSTPHPAAFARSLLGTQLLRSWYMAAFQVPVLPEAVLARTLPWALRRSGLPADRADHYAARRREAGASRGALNCYRAAARSRAAVTVGRIAVPTLYVWSTRDVALGRAAAERTADHVDGPYRFEVLDGVGHWITETVPEELDRLLLPFLDCY